MKKFIAFVFSLLTVIALFSSCKNGVVNNNAIVKDVQYFNQKAINNLDELIGLPADEAEKWIDDTFGDDELFKQEGQSLVYFNNDKTVKLWLIMDDAGNRFFIAPNYEEDLNGKSRSLVDEDYLNTVNDYCSNKNADYKNPPTMCSLSVFNFDKADNTTELQYDYLFTEDGGWSTMYGDEGPYNSIRFVYQNGSFELK